jgi:hypothetical protein
VGEKPRQRCSLWPCLALLVNKNKAFVQRSRPALRQLIHKTRKQSAAGSDQLVAASTDWEYQTASSQVFTHLLPLHKRTDFFLPSPLLPILPPSQSVLSSGNGNLQLGLAASRPRASCTAPVLLQFSLQCSAHLLSPLMLNTTPV